MAENNSPLSIVIDADISKLQKAISDVRESIGQISAAVQKTDLGDFGKGLEQTLSQINTRLDQLEGNLQKTSTTAKAFTTGTKDARTALTSLSLVAQDAPFGFIAIQNNLPAVLSSFSELTKGSAGLKGALSQIGSALVGPAGLFLAFSAVTGAVTFAIQKYGSLGAAIDAITGNTNEFTEAIRKADKSLDEYNKNARSNIEVRNDSIGSVENEIIKVNALADVLRSSTTTDRQKQGALSELKKANDEYFGKLNAQKIDLDALNESVKLYSESLIKNKVAQNLASEAAGVFTEFLKQNQIAFDIAEKINKAFKDVPSLTKELEDYTKKRDKLIAQGEITAIRFIPISKELAQYFKLNDQLKEVNTNVKSTANSYETLATQADAAFKAASSFLDLGKDGKDGGINVRDILKLDSQELDEAFNLKDIISSLKEYGNIILNVNNTDKQRRDALNKLIAINPEYLAGLSTEKSSLNTVKQRVEDLIRTYEVLKKEREFAARASKINAEFLKNELKGIEEPVDLTNKYNLVPKVKPIKLDDLVDFSFDLEKIAKPIKSLRDFQTELDITGAILNYKTNITSLGEVYKLTFGELVEKNKELASSIQGFLYEPLENIFDILLEKGKKSWKEFGNSIIATLKRIAAQIAATFIAKGIANILAPGLGSISKGALGEWLGQDFNDITGGFAMNDIRPGGMQMSGQVVFVQRGSDLVGVLNRTNGTINRVG